MWISPERKVPVQITTCEQLITRPQSNGRFRTNKGAYEEQTLLTQCHTLYLRTYPRVGRIRAFEDEIEDSPWSYVKIRIVE
jgi:hypothetical protein